MIFVYLDVVGAFVVPLLAVYIMGVFTKVHRQAATVGLVVGGLYGLATLVGPWMAEEYGVMILPAAALGRFATAPLSLLLTAGTMIIVSLFLGWQDRNDQLQPESLPWLRESQQHLTQTTCTGDESQSRLPLACGLIVLGAGMALSFLVFW